MRTLWGAMNKSGVLWPLYSSSLTWHRRGTIVNERTKMMVASLGVCFILEAVLIVQRRACLCKSVSVALWVNQRYCSSKLASSPRILPKRCAIFWIFVRLDPNFCRMAYLTY